VMPGLAPGRPDGARFAVSLVINAVVPVLVYLLIRPHLHSDTTALVIAAAIPVCYTAVVLLWRRRLDPVGVIAIAGFAFGLLLLVVTGGNELAFKLREDAWTGPVGLACLISVAVRRPLLLLVLRLAARRNADIAERLRAPGIRRITTVSTLVIGLILVVHALVLITLALTTSTATYLALSKPISWAIVGAGLVPLVWWIRRQHRGGPDRGSGPGQRGTSSSPS
jgi:hypothetical protein